MEFQFKKITTIYESHIDHIWTNAPTQQCMSKIKAMYFAFKLLDYIPQFHHIG
jgi:hypothetical protein